MRDEGEEKNGIQARGVGKELQLYAPFTVVRPHNLPNIRQAALISRASAFKREHAHFVIFYQQLSYYPKAGKRVSCG